MRFLVTGAAGFIGSAICKELLVQGHPVIGVDCYLTDLYSDQIKRKKIEELSQSSNFSFEQLDLREQSLSHLLPGVDILIHEAALPGLLPAEQFEHLYFSCNFQVTRNVLEDLRLHPRIHLVHASTSSVYGPFVNGGEEQPLVPVSPYAISKLRSEKLISEYRQNFGISSSILRYFSVYGPGQRPDMAYATICRKLLSGERIYVSGDGKQTRTNTHIDDVVRATILAATAQVDGLIANICGSEEIELLSAIDRLAGEADVEPLIEFAPARPGDQRRVFGDSTRARVQLGWTPLQGISDGLRSQMLEAKETLLVQR